MWFLKVGVRRDGRRRHRRRDWWLADTPINENLAAPTGAVTALEELLRSAESAYGWKWEREVTIRHNIVDFCEARSRIVIECDGAPHFSEDGIIDDIRREIECAREGFLVLRFENRDVLADLDRMLGRIGSVYRDRYRASVSGKCPRTQINESNLGILFSRVQALGIEEQRRIAEAVGERWASLSSKDATVRRFIRDLKDNAILAERTRKTQG